MCVTFTVGITFSVVITFSGDTTVWVGMDLNSKNVWLTLFKFSHFLFVKCAGTDHKLFLSRIELISFLSLF